MSLHRLSPEQGLNLWAELVTAYHGINAYGGDVAEIYVAGMLDQSAFAVAEQANTVLYLLRMFGETMDADVEIERGPSDWAPPDIAWMAMNGHRWHVRVTPRNVPNTEAEILGDASAFDRFHTYMRAFKAGAGMSQLGEWHTLAKTHADPAIRDAWTDGYAHGRRARAEAAARASGRFGHVPNVLRVQEDK